MKIHSISRLLIIIAVGAVPGFVKFDTSGLSQDFGMINPQSITRMLIYAVMGFMFIALVLFRPPKIPNGESKANNFWVWVLLGYFSIYLVFSAIVLPFHGFAVAGYRVAEWILVISICWYFILSCWTSETHFNKIGDEFLSILRIMTSVKPVVVLIGVVLVPDLAYSYSSETGTFRFGGYLYTPNGLGVYCGIGSVLFWMLPKRRTDRLWSVALFVCMLLTYSRGAVIAFAVFILYYNFVSGSFVRKILASFILLVCFIIFLSGDFSRGAFSAFSRGDSVASITTLNGRTVVWDASLKAIAESPLVGHGFIQGPKKLKNYMEDTWWAPSHSHNDILNAGVSGGWSLAALTLFIYLMAAYKLYGLKMSAGKKAVAASILIQSSVYSIVTPVLSIPVNHIGLTLVLFLGFLFTQPQLPETNMRLSQRYAYPDSP
jgi:O-antigen ligase